jgi:DNA-directed RNA polymerase specialized sigma subunit
VDIAVEKVKVRLNMASINLPKILVEEKRETDALEDQAKKLREKIFEQRVKNRAVKRASEQLEEKTKLVIKIVLT